MKKNTYRLIFLSLTLLLMLTVFIGVNFYQDNDETIELPTVIEGISPLPNYQVPQQTSIEINSLVEPKLYLAPQAQVVSVFAKYPGCPSFFIVLRF